MESVTLRADPRRRRIVFTVLALAVILAVLSVFLSVRLLSDWADQLATDQLVERFRLLLSILLVGCGLCFLALAAHLVFLSGRIRASGCWPLPGTPVLFDRVQLQGEAALRVARRLRVLAIVLCCCGLATAGISLRLFLLVLHGG